MHPNNLHIKGYNYIELASTHPPLQKFIRDNGYGRLSIDYADNDAVFALNKALLETHYGVKNWWLPAQALCPPVPGRADYLLHLADFLAEESNSGIIPKGNCIHVLDIGTGASAIYPILGYSMFGWSFLASDSHAASVTHIEKHLKEENPHLKDVLETRLQLNNQRIFDGIIHNDEFFDITVCNPPFHTSAEDAERRTKRKWKQLGLSEKMHSTKSFGGASHELWCEGGEVAFLQKMIQESAHYATQVMWFTSLVSRKSTLPFLDKAFGAVQPIKKWVIDMGQGQKSSRFIAWTFLDDIQQKAWAKYRFIGL